MSLVLGYDPLHSAAYPSEKQKGFRTHRLPQKSPQISRDGGISPDQVRLAAGSLRNANPYKILHSIQDLAFNMNSNSLEDLSLEQKATKEFFKKIIMGFQNFAIENSIGLNDQKIFKDKLKNEKRTPYFTVSSSNKVESNLRILTLQNARGKEILRIELGNNKLIKAESGNLIYDFPTNTIIKTNQIELSKAS